MILELLPPKVTPINDNVPFSDRNDDGSLSPKATAMEDNGGHIGDGNHTERRRNS